MKVHEKENNEESQSYLDDNRPKFKSQNKRLLEYLQKGNHIDSIKAMKELNIFHLARRILDLKENGIIIKDKRIKGGFKSYWIE